MNATIDEFTRFQACALGLMNSDLKVRSAGETRDRCAAAADELRRSLRAAGLKYRPGSRRELQIENYDRLLSVVAIGDLEQTLGLLVELCACAPWAQVEGQPQLDVRAREQFLGQLAIDLPGDSDEDDVEYIDRYLKEGRNLAGWSTGRWAVVIGGGVLAFLVTGGVGTALIAGGAAVAAGGAAVGAALAAATAAEVAAAAAATVLVGAGGTFTAAVLSSEMSPDLVDLAVVKRFALIRILRRYPLLQDAARSRFDELVTTREDVESQRSAATSDDERKELDRKMKSFSRAIERLENDG
jgi:hypothetical protein